MPAAPDFAVRRFQSAAAHYVAGRAPYPPALFARTAELVELTPRDRLLDLGCGPGQIAAGFAPFVGAVVAMDPEPAMLALARKRLAAVPNADVVAGSSEELGPGLGRFRIVTIGRAFHWMDRERTLARLDALIEPGGAVILFGDERPDIPENAWLKGYRALLDPYRQDDDGRPRRRTPPHVSVLLASAFSRLERISVMARRALDVDGLVEQALSRSATSRARLGDAADTMVADIRSHAPAWSADGHYTEMLWSTALVARRPHDG
jgi:SAM-dependent methyltransferase